MSRQELRMPHFVFPTAILSFLLRCKQIFNDIIYSIVTELYVPERLLL